MPNSRHRPAIFSPSSRRATNLRRSSMGLHSFQGILLSRQKARLCNPCLRNELSPLPQEGHARFRASQDLHHAKSRSRMPSEALAEEGYLIREETLVVATLV